MSRAPTVHVPVNQIVVRPGETLTVFLRVSDKIQYQVELRVREPLAFGHVTPIAEIFSHDEEDHLRPHLTFEEWEPMP